MPHRDHYVIIGNGPAGNHAAATLRNRDKEAEITIISDECAPFYYKPRLTGYIANEIDEHRLLVNSLETYKQKDIGLRLGRKIVKIDPGSKQVFCAHMEVIPYSKLIIASGSTARLLPSMKAYAEHLKFITSYADVMAYKDRIQAAKSFFLFGGDLVGFKFLKMLNSMGKNITLMVHANAFWPFTLNDDMLDSVFTSLSKYDVSILVKDDISTIEKNTNGYTVKTLRGLEKTVDMVFSFNGLIPNIDFVQGSGINTDHGILVNEYLKTNVDDIYACGSCAQIYNPFLKTHTTSIGWANAAVQGETAAFNLLGDQHIIEYAGRKYFDLEGVKFKTTWWEDFDTEPNP